MAVARGERAAAAVAEPGLRYGLLRGLVRVPTLEEWLRGVLDAAVWLVLAPLIGRLLWRMGLRGAAARHQRWWAGRLQRALGVRIDWAGLDLIDRDERYVVAPLHEGFADAIALLQLPLRLRFVVRDELLGWPLLGPYLRDTEQIAVRPEAGVGAYRAIRRAGPGIVAGGESVVVFPQGSILGIEVACRGGVVAVARALDRPILPIAVTGGHRVWEHPFSPRLRRGERMSVRVLPPISAAAVREGEPDEIRRAVERRLTAAALDGVMVPPRRFVPVRDGFWPGYAYEIGEAFPALAAEVAAWRGGGGDAIAFGLGPGATGEGNGAAREW